MTIGKDLSHDIERLRLGRVGDALAGLDAWIVGGVARALVTNTDPDADIDIAVDADLEPVLERLGLPAKRHDRFGTAVIDLGDGRHADIARTRTEAYEAPGALPAVTPAPIDEDLARRDFTVNAIAIAPAPAQSDPRSVRRHLRSRRRAAPGPAPGIVHRRPDESDPGRPLLRPARPAPGGGDGEAARRDRPRARQHRSPQRRAHPARRRARPRRGLPAALALGGPAALRSIAGADRGGGPGPADPRLARPGAGAGGGDPARCRRGRGGQGRRPAARCREPGAALGCRRAGERAAAGNAPPRRRGRRRLGEQLHGRLAPDRARDQRSGPARRRYRAGPAGRCRTSGCPRSEVERRARGGRERELEAALRIARAAI